MLKWFWPIRTGITFLDYWSLSHFGFWFVVGATLATASRGWVAVCCLAVAFGWEVFERFAEVTWPRVWLSPESWVNSWISDPLMCILGLLVAWYGYDNWR